MLDWLAYLGETTFTPEQYLWWTRWQCLAWTTADVVIVLALTRLTNLARSQAAKSPDLFPYVIVLFTLFFVPLLFFVPTGGLVFALELIITVPHFLLILYLLAMNHRHLAALVTALEERAKR